MPASCSTPWIGIGHSVYAERGALRRWGPVATRVELDAEIPPFDRLSAEAATAEQALSGGFAGWRARRLIIRLEQENPDGR